MSDWACRHANSQKSPTQGSAGNAWVQGRLCDFGSAPQPCGQTSLGRAMAECALDQRLYIQLVEPVRLLLHRVRGRPGREECLRKDQQAIVAASARQSSEQAARQQGAGGAPPVCSPRD